MKTEVVLPSTSVSMAGHESMAMEMEKNKKLYAEDDISKLAVIKSNDTIAMKYMMCVAAASVAEGVTYPLDLTKTRLQIQGEVRTEGKPVKYRGMTRTALGIMKEEGFFSFMAWDDASSVQTCHLYRVSYVCLRGDQEHPLQEGQGWILTLEEGGGRNAGRRYRSVHGVPHGPDKDPDPDGG